jgi:hypothetical protein
LFCDGSRSQASGDWDSDAASIEWLRMRTAINVEGRCGCTDSSDATGAVDSVN